MKKKKSTISPRKKPLQKRARVTVDSILEAATHILNKAGVDKLSTNTIAEVAGVSIGSLYQYFPNKEAIVSSLLEKYVEDQFDQISGEMEKHGGEKLEDVVRAVIRAQMAGKRKSARLNKIVAQMLFKIDGLNKMEKIDDRMMDYFKQYIDPLKGQIREENIEWRLFIVFQVVKLLPVAVMFHSRFDINDPVFEEEMVHLIVQYLKK